MTAQHGIRRRQSRALDALRRRTAELEAALRENEKVHRTLRESEAKFRALVSQSLVGIVIVEDGKFSYTNHKFEEMFGYNAAELRLLGPADLAVGSDLPPVAGSMKTLLNGEVQRIERVFRARRKNGEIFDAEVHGSLMDVDGRPSIIAIVIDVTERIRAEREILTLQEKLREQSTHDALTGLFNRHYLEHTLSRELLLAERRGRSVSVIMGDLDHFKSVNDHYGHLAGDEVLRVFGRLMKQHARGSDIYCRYGGEEFLLVMPEMEAGKAFERAEQLRCAIAATPINHGNATINVTASFGVATYPRSGRTGDELIAAADKALYAAKTAGRNRVLASAAHAQTAPAASSLP